MNCLFFEELKKSGIAKLKKMDRECNVLLDRVPSDCFLYYLTNVWKMSAGLLTFRNLLLSGQFVETVSDHS